MEELQQNSNAYPLDTRWRVSTNPEEDDECIGKFDMEAEVSQGADIFGFEVEGWSFGLLFQRDKVNGKENRKL